MHDVGLTGRQTLKPITHRGGLRFLEEEHWSGGECQSPVIAVGALQLQRARGYGAADAVPFVTSQKAAGRRLTRSVSGFCLGIWPAQTVLNQTRELVRVARSSWRPVTCFKVNLLRWDDFDET